MSGWPAMIILDNVIRKCIWYCQSNSGASHPSIWNHYPWIWSMVHCCQLSIVSKKKNINSIDKHFTNHIEGPE